MATTRRFFSPVMRPQHINYMLNTLLFITATLIIFGRGGLDGAGVLFSITPLVRNLGIMSAIVLGFVLLNVAYRTTRTRLTARHKPE